MTLAIDTADREIRMMRVLDAPRDLVFRIWTDPAHIARWWGPRGFTTTTHASDVRPGGFWKFTMHGPDGADYPNYIAYQEIVAPERIVYDHKASGDEVAGHFLATVTFTAQGDRTLVDFRLLFPSKADRDRAATDYGANEGGVQTLDRLQEIVAGDDTPRRFVISRQVKAPRDLVWKVYTEVEHLKRWFGPKGSTITTATLDFRVGGRFHYCMQFGAMEMWGRWIFRAIEPKDRFVHTSEFSDAAGGLTRAPFGTEWPMTTLGTVSFLDEGETTLVTVDWYPLDATDAELAVFEAGRDSMIGGWTGTFQQLEAYLEEVG